MIYILDSSFFIETSRLHLPLDKQPIFWNWLVKLAKAKVISIPSMVYEELIAGDDRLAVWMQANKEALVNQNAAYDQISRVMAEGYEPLMKSPSKYSGPIRGSLPMPLL